MAGNLVVDQKRFDQLSKTRTFPLMGLGISFKATENLEYYGNLSQNFRAVTFNDLRVVNPNFRVDSALRDEYGYNLDLGIRGSEANAYSFDLSVFHMRYNGRIGSLLKNDGISEYRYRTNIADSRVLGLEAFGEINVLKYLLPASKATLFAFATGSLTDARYINTEDLSVLDKRMELAPTMLLRSGLQLGLGKFSASLQMAHTAQQFTDATNAIRTVNAVDGEIPAYTVIDFSARYKARHWALEAGVNNLANSIYFTRRAEAYPGPGIIPSDGRSVYLGLQVNF
jgi:Fe(3+) dicitrate transport protein